LALFSTINAKRVSREHRGAAETHGLAAQGQAARSVCSNSSHSPSFDAPMTSRCRFSLSSDVRAPF
jgi:hypothetical protein